MVPSWRHRRPPVSRLGWRGGRGEWANVPQRERSMSAGSTSLLMQASCYENEKRMCMCVSPGIEPMRCSRTCNETTSRPQETNTSAQAQLMEPLVRSTVVHGKDHMSSTPPDDFWLTDAMYWHVPVKGAARGEPIQDTEAISFP